MALIAFDTNKSSQGEPEPTRGVSKGHAAYAKEVSSAVMHLMQHKSLTHTFGNQGEWEVRTTLLMNRHPWRYYSIVLVRGKEASQEFPSIEVDQARHLRQVGEATEEMMAAFAREAVEVHFTRCASVTEYCMMTSIFSKPVRRLQRIKKIALTLFGVAVLLTVYWWWQDTHHIVLNQPASKPLTPSVQWQSPQVTYHLPAGEPFELPLPALERLPGGSPIEITLQDVGETPSWLELNRERLSIRGTAPLATVNQTYRLTVHARTAAGSDSRLLLLLTILDQPASGPTTPKLRGHWTW
jgi:hypothetical protein